MATELSETNQFKLYKAGGARREDHEIMLVVPTRKDRSRSSCQMEGVNFTGLVSGLLCDCVKTTCSCTRSRRGYVNE